MLDILKCFHSDEEADSMDNDDGLVDSALSEETIQKIMSGVQITMVNPRLSEALSYCLEQTCYPAFRHMGGSQFGLGILDDVVSLLSLGGDGLIKAGMKEVKMDKRHKETKGKSKSGERRGSLSRVSEKFTFRSATRGVVIFGWAGDGGKECSYGL